MQKRRVQSYVPIFRVYDLPEVIVRDDLERAIKAMKVRVGRLGTYVELKNRRKDVSLRARRKAKKKRALKRLK